MIFGPPNRFVPARFSSWDYLHPGGALCTVFPGKVRIETTRTEAKIAENPKLPSRHGLLLDLGQDLVVIWAPPRCVDYVDLWTYKSPAPYFFLKNSGKGSDRNYS